MLSNFVNSPKYVKEEGEGQEWQTTNTIEVDFQEM